MNPLIRPLFGLSVSQPVINALKGGKLHVHEPIGELVSDGTPTFT